MSRVNLSLFLCKLFSMKEWTFFNTSHCGHDILLKHLPVIPTCLKKEKGNRGIAVLCKIFIVSLTKKLTSFVPTSSIQN